MSPGRQESRSASVPRCSTVPGVNDCTERHPAEPGYGLDGAGYEGTPREIQS
jgi:hypothetical protein